MFRRCLQWMLGAALRSCGLLLVVAACATPAFASHDFSVPEIDPGSMGSALALLAGGLLMLTGRRRSS
jgi:hypothetical protein